MELKTNSGRASRDHILCFPRCDCVRNGLTLADFDLVSHRASMEIVICLPTLICPRW